MFENNQVWVINKAYDLEFYNCFQKINNNTLLTKKTNIFFLILKSIKQYFWFKLIYINKYILMDSIISLKMLD